MTGRPLGPFRKFMDDIWANRSDAEPYRFLAVKGEHSLLEWACDADAHTAGRVHARQHLLVDRAGRAHLATTVLHEPRKRGNGHA